MSEIKITPESYRTAQITPITLSESQRVKMIFDARQVDNLNDLKKNIKGKLIIKKKDKTIATFSEDCKFSKKDISSKEYIEISLNTEETYNLARGLFTYYRLLSGKTTNPFLEITYVEKDDRIAQLMELLSSEEDLLAVFSKIDITSVNTAINIENLKRAKQEMIDNMENDHEAAFWQTFFEKNGWILSQLFHAPLLFFKGKKYLGGKSLDDHGGQYADFLFQNEITENVAIVEIKTPVKALIGSSYRQTYTVSEEVNGGVNQILKQKNELLNNYNALFAKAAKEGNSFNANNIECILVVGNVSLLSPEQQAVFDMYRNELRSVRIVGFDELLKRIENLLALFEYE